MSPFFQIFFVYLSKQWLCPQPENTLLLLQSLCLNCLIDSARNLILVKIDAT